MACARSAVPGFRALAVQLHERVGGEDHGGRDRLRRRATSSAFCAASVYPLAGRELRRRALLALRGKNLIVYADLSSAPAAGASRRRGSAVYYSTPR